LYDFFSRVSSRELWRDWDTYHKIQWHFVVYRKSQKNDAEKSFQHGRNDIYLIFPGLQLFGIDSGARSVYHVFSSAPGCCSRFLDLIRRFSVASEVDFWRENLKKSSSAKQGILVGGIPTPSKHISQWGGWHPIYEMENKKCLNHQSEYVDHPDPIHSLTPAGIEPAVIYIWDQAPDIPNGSLVAYPNVSIHW